MMCRQLLKDTVLFLSGPDKEERTFKGHLKRNRVWRSRPMGRPVAVLAGRRKELNA